MEEDGYKGDQETEREARNGCYTTECGFQPSHEWHRPKVRVVAEQARRNKTKQNKTKVEGGKGRKEGMIRGKRGGGTQLKEF